MDEFRRRQIADDQEFNNLLEQVVLNSKNRRRGTKKDLRRRYVVEPYSLDGYVDDRLNGSGESRNRNRDVGLPGHNFPSRGSPDFGRPRPPRPGHGQTRFMDDYRNRKVEDRVNNILDKIRRKIGYESPFKDRGGRSRDGGGKDGSHGLP